MPRGRKSKQIKEKHMDKKLGGGNLTDEEDLSIEKKKDTSKIVSEDIEDLETSLLNLNEMHEFIKVKKGSIIAVCYLIPTNELGKEDSKIQIKTNIVKSLQNTAEAKGMHINMSRIHVKTYPRGAKTYVKAWFDIYDATGRKAPKIDRKTKPPKEGLWIDEEERITQ